MDVIKTSNYTAEDIKVFLKRKTQTSGRHLLTTGSNEINSFINAVSDKDGNVYCLDAVGDEIKKYDKFGDFVISKNLAGIEQPENLYISRNVFFLSHKPVGGNDTVKIYDIDFNLIHEINENFAIPFDMVKDSKDKLLIVKSGTNTVEVREHGDYRAETAAINVLPTGVACDSDGNVYICDNDSGTPANTEIRKFDSDGVEIVAGNWPISPGFDAPSLAVDYLDTNDVYVVDKVNYIIRRYDSAGAFIEECCEDPAQEELLFISVNATYIITLNANNDITAWSKSPFVLVKSMNGQDDGIAINKDDIIFYIDNTEIVARGIDGVIIAQSNLSLNNPADITILEDNQNTYLAVTEEDQDKVIKIRYNGPDDALISFTDAGEFGATGAGNGQFNQPYAIAWSPLTDDIVVTDLTNTDVQYLNWGYGTDDFGATGAGDGQFQDISGIGCDNSRNAGYVYVSESTTGARVQKFDSNYTYIAQLAVAGGVSDMDVNEEGRPFIGLVSSKQVLIYQRGSDTAFGDYYSTFFSRSNVSSLDITNGGIFTAENLDRLYTGKSTEFHIYGVTSNFVETFEQDWYDITRYVIMKDDFNISITNDGTDFSIGALKYGTVNVTLNNNTNFFASEYNENSIFFDEKYRTCRHGSMIKITLKDNNLFTGFIDAKQIDNKGHEISFNLISIMRKFEQLKLVDLDLTDDDPVSVIVEKIVDNYELEGFFEYNAGDIDIYYDAVVDDVSELPETADEILKFLSKVALFNFGYYNDNKFYTYSFPNHIQDRDLDYIITQNNMIDKIDFNAGEHRLFTKVLYGLQEYQPDGRVRWIYPESRKVDISGDSITDPVVRQQIVDNYSFLTQFPSKEITLPIPLLLLPDNKLASKQFAFNIFTNDRGLNFNTKSLVLENALLPTKETALDENDSGERILYRILGIKHKAGKSFITELKMKEIIDDDAP